MPRRGGASSKKPGFMWYAWQYPAPDMPDDHVEGPSLRSYDLHDDCVRLARLYIDVLHAEALPVTETPSPDPAKPLTFLRTMADFLLHETMPNLRRHATLSYLDCLDQHVRAQTAEPPDCAAESLGMSAAAGECTTLRNASASQPATDLGPPESGTAAGPDGLQAAAASTTADADCVAAEQPTDAGCAPCSDVEHAGSSGTSGEAGLVAMEVTISQEAAETVPSPGRRAAQAQSTVRDPNSKMAMPHRRGRHDNEALLTRRRELLRRVFEVNQDTDSVTLLSEVRPSLTADSLLADAFRAFKRAFDLQQQSQQPQPQQPPQPQQQQQQQQQRQRQQLLQMQSASTEWEAETLLQQQAISQPHVPTSQPIIGHSTPPVEQPLDSQLLQPAQPGQTQPTPQPGQAQPMPQPGQVQPMPQPTTPPVSGMQGESVQARPLPLASSLTQLHESTLSSAPSMLPTAMATAMAPSQTTAMPTAATPTAMASAMPAAMAAATAAPAPTAAVPSWGMATATAVPMAPVQGAVPQATQGELNATATAAAAPIAAFPGAAAILTDRSIFDATTLPGAARAVSSERSKGLPAPAWLASAQGGSFCDEMAIPGLDAALCEVQRFCMLQFPSETKKQSRLKLKKTSAASALEPSQMPAPPPPVHQAPVATTAAAPQASQLLAALPSLPPATMPTIGKAPAPAGTDQEVIKMTAADADLMEEAMSVSAEAFPGLVIEDLD